MSETTEGRYYARQCRGHWHVSIDWTQGGEMETSDITTDSGIELSETVARHEAARLNAIADRLALGA